MSAGTELIPASDALDTQLDRLLVVGFRAICDDEDISEVNEVDDIIWNTVFPVRSMVGARVVSHQKRRHARDRRRYRKQIYGD